MTVYAGTYGPQRIGLAYATAKYINILPNIIANIQPTTNLWEYALPANDPSPLVSDYFYDARTRGMLSGDVIFIANAGYALVVTSVLASGSAQVTANSVAYLQAQTNRSYNFFHGYAENQLLGDQVFFDISGNNNHAVPGANINKGAGAGQLFGNAGYLTTATPAGGAADTSLRAPNLNFNYLGGEKIFVILQANMATPAANTNILGDGYGTSSTQRGIAVASTTLGKAYIAVYGATAKVGNGSTATVFDGTLHTFAFYLDGSTRQYGQWVDGNYDAAFAGEYKPFYQSDTLDTINSNTFNMGATSPAPGSTSQPVGGNAIKLRTVSIYRFPASYPQPSVATLTTAVNAIMANPGVPLLPTSL